MMINSYRAGTKKTEAKENILFKLCFHFGSIFCYFSSKKKEKLSCEFIFHISFSYNFFLYNKEKGALYTDNTTLSYV
jgi:hypothetical protein